jgi:hypothetical protein
MARCVLLGDQLGPAPHKPADDERRLFSQLSPWYLRYDRALFVDTLNDWGWFGEGPLPSWYSGEPWTTS